MNYVFETASVEYDTPVYSIEELDTRDTQVFTKMPEALQETIKSIIESRGLVHTHYDSEKQLITYTFESLEKGIPQSPMLANPKSISIQF